jgi:hypothetical protein
MKYFTAKNSIVRKIWGSPDTELFIFAGAAAEFAVNKAVDWLYFTGRLPADPLGRLFSTVVYANKIIFSELDDANRAIDQITAIHKTVEQNRQAQIPAWAYRDVLFMLIYYSITSFEVLHRKLSDTEKEEIFDVFYRVGARMGLTDLPQNYKDWTIAYEQHLQNDTVFSDFTIDLYKQYRKHLGYIRFQILRQVQILIVPPKINQLLSLGRIRFIIPVLWVYRLSRKFKLGVLIIKMVLPKVYGAQVENLQAA